MSDSLEIYVPEQPQPLPAYHAEPCLTDYALYLPSRRLRRAVDVAVALGKPLLLTGEPGTGKTELAHSVAWSFEQQVALTFNTRTSSNAGDLFYHYHSLKHFHYTQIQENPPLDDGEIEKRYIRYAALGEAIRRADPAVVGAGNTRRSVVLIDEVDKAPRDLPNDILNVLEDLAFDVPEIDKSYRAEPACRPVIVLTSNNEKSLPDAFLRRCVYFHIDFPGDDDLLEILARRVPGKLYTTEVIKETVLPHFEKIRKTVARKKPATSELIYWVSLLERLQFPPENLKYDKEKLDDESYQTLLTSYTVMIKSQEDLKLLKRR